MEYITIAIAVIGCVISVTTFFKNGKNEETKDVKEKTRAFAKHDLIEYRLTELEKKLDKVLDLLDGFDKEIDQKIEKRFEQHILIYHKGVK